MTTTMINLESKSKGIGRKERQRMIRRWKIEGNGLSLKEWAKQQGVGDAALAWKEAKR